MKRLLLVTSRFPYPPVGGDRLRVYHLARLLARHYRVELLALGPQRVSEETVAEFRARTGVAEARSIEQSLARSLLGAAGALLHGQPLQVGWFANRELQAAFDAALARADVLVLHLIRTAALWRRQRPLPALLDLCDAISHNLEQVRREGSWLAPRTWVALLEARRVARFERQSAARADLVSFVAAADRALLGMDEPRAFVLTQGVELADFQFLPPPARRGDAVALIGKMDTFPNRSAALWAARELVPRLPAPMTLRIVGDCPEPLKRELQAFPRVVVTGRVPSIAEACRDCFAAIAPLNVATGIQNKVLESFAMGLPTVLSPSVARGLLPQAAGGYRVAAMADEWAAALAALHAGGEDGAALAAKARAYVEQHHAWDRLGDGLHRRLQAIGG